jgi:hypothetical protein
MADKALLALWESIEGHLSAALDRLPPGDLEDLGVFHDFLDHNELELAWEQSCIVGRAREAGSGFWVELDRAGGLMGLRPARKAGEQPCRP